MGPLQAVQFSCPRRELLYQAGLHGAFYCFLVFVGKAAAQSSLNLLQSSPREATKFGFPYWSQSDEL